MKRITLLLIITIGISILAQGQSSDIKKLKTMNQDTLKKYMQQTMHDFAIPGLAVSIFTGDKILNKEVLGVRRLHTNDSIKVNDRFHLGSNGKAITGFVAGRLVEKELITWDTKVFDIFPELKDSSNSIYKNVTFEELLSHRSKVRPFEEDNEWALLTNFQGNDNMRRRYDFSKWLLKQPPVEIDSIKKYTYSNAGYAVAASMMEKVTGKQWENLINDELFTPLNIHCSFGWPALEDKNQPWGHWIMKGDSLLTPHPPNDKYQMDEILTPAGGYSMSILDYTKFLQLNLKGINGTDTLLKSSTYNYLHYCNFDPNSPLLGWYSIGWGVFRTPSGHTISVHDGSAETFYCFTILFRELDFGITIITNSGENESKNGVKKLRKSIERHFK